MQSTIFAPQYDTQGEPLIRMAKYQKTNTAQVVGVSFNQLIRRCCYGVSKRPIRAVVYKNGVEVTYPNISSLSRPW